MQKKCIIVGVTGGIAAFKACSLVSHLVKQGHEVHVLMTKGATEFVSPLTFQTLAKTRVILDMFSADYEPDVHHISLAEKADVFVVAPATADFIAKAAHGIADDMLTTTFLAATCDKWVVPAMNTHMFENPITQKNIQTLKENGIGVMEPDSGLLACGDVGKGRMPEPDEIIDAIGPLGVRNPFLKGKKILITAGPTQEAMDPVRYITNHSTGKMGYALAKKARDLGAEVVLVSGKTNLAVPYGIQYRPIVSAQDLADAVLEQSDSCDAVIMAAAVADYTPTDVASEKIKKADGDLSISVKRTTDVLLQLGKQKKPGQVLIGFAMETEHLLENARTKLDKKNADYIVANSIREKGAGFGTDTNHVIILSKDHQEDVGILSKEDTAEYILQYCLEGK